MLDETKKKFDISVCLNDFKGEYKKIVWPDFKNLCRQTYTVIVTCFSFGAIIFLMDATYGFCSNYAFSFLSK